MLIGLPGSGKSYIANSFKNNGYIVHSSDNLREEMFGDINNQSNNNDLFKKLHKRIKTDLYNKNDVIMDCTNISSKRRRGFLSNISSIDCNKKCLVLASTFEKCCERNFNRERKVPLEVLKKMYYSFEVPGYFEGWDEIELVYANDDSYSKYTDILDTIGFNQNNPHHTLSLDLHLERAASILYSLDPDDRNLYIATLYHDIGKLKTQTFGDKGCHYYNHENVGAYDCMFYMKEIYNLSDYDIIDICTLVQYHMRPYFFKKQSTVNKYKRIWGDKLFDRTMKLHQADMLAH